MVEVEEPDKEGEGGGGGRDCWRDVKEDVVKSRWGRRRVFGKLLRQECVHQCEGAMKTLEQTMDVWMLAT